MSSQKKNSARMNNEKPHYYGHRKRLRERFLGAEKFDKVDSIPDYEIIEIILFSSYPRKDVKPLAKKLIKNCGSFAKIFSTSQEKLKNEFGLTENAIANIKAVYESSLRILKNDIEERPILQSWKGVIDYCLVAMSDKSEEQFRVLFLNQKNKLIADEILQQGTVDQTPVYPREVVKRALELGASALILVHNHPSGDPTPSKADIEVTEKIELALTSVDIRLHDHLIIAGKDHFSFAGNGLI